MIPKTLAPAPDELQASPIARAFGADVAVDRPQGASLFFLVGRTGPPDHVVREHRGSIVTRLPDPRRVLALLPLAAYSDLARRPELVSAGPVAVDPVRFGAFARLLGLDDASADPARPPP